MADVTQNISAQLFVKELPNAQRADFNGCKQDFNSNNFTMCDNYVDSDNAVENAFQQQLNLSEYYKSPYVFDTLKKNYMAKTMDAHFETEEVNLEPERRTMPPEVTSAQQNITQPPPQLSSIKETFGAMSDNKTSVWILIILISIVFFIIHKK